MPTTTAGVGRGRRASVYESVYCACGAQWHGDVARPSNTAIARHRDPLKKNRPTDHCRVLNHEHFAQRFHCQCKECARARRAARALAMGPRARKGSNMAKVTINATAAPPVVPPFAVVEAFPDDAAVDLGNGEYAIVVGARPDVSRNGLATTDPNCDPSQPGDVVSVQPDGAIQSRPAGTTGLYERCVKVGASWVFRPKGVDGRTFMIPRATAAPNA